METKILIYDRDVKVRSALKSFFAKKRGYQTEFRDTPPSDADLARIEGSEATVCFLPARDLKAIRNRGRTVLFATVPQGPRAEEGIRTALKQKADCHLVWPFCDADLEFKLEAVFARNRAVSRLETEAANLQALIDLTYLVSSTLDTQEILYLIVKKISEVIPVTRCSIIRVDGGGKHAIVVSTFENPRLRNIKLDLRKYPEIKRALQSREPVVITDVNSDPLMDSVRDIIFPLGIRSIVVIPIVFHEEVIGTLFLRTSRASSAFSESEVKLCNAIANVSANSLYNAFLFEKIEDEKSRLEKLAITDFLTGVYNIRYFYHRLTEEFSRAERYNLPLSCLMFDIDHFKKINDQHGHRTGDFVLREFAQLLKKHTRQSDVLARYGGEEFIMLLTQTPESGAVAKAEDLRVHIEKHSFRGLKSKKGPTVSIGVSSRPAPEIRTKEDLITVADNALYLAKTKGRNLVISSCGS